MNQDQARPQQIRLHVCRRLLKSTRRNAVPIAFAVDLVPISSWPDITRAWQSRTDACAGRANVAWLLRSSSDKLVHCRAGCKKARHHSLLCLPAAYRRGFHSLLPLFFPKRSEQALVKNRQSPGGLCGRCYGYFPATQHRCHQASACRQRSPW